MNTNAPLLSEKKCYDILSSGFSADVADEELFKALRINGNLDVVFKNVKLFKEIKDKH